MFGPATIFTGQLPGLDANFINPSDKTIKKNVSSTVSGAFKLVGAEIVDGETWIKDSKRDKFIEKSKQKYKPEKEFTVGSCSSLQITSAVNSSSSTSQTLIEYWKSGDSYYAITDTVVSASANGAAGAGQNTNLWKCSSVEQIQEATDLVNGKSIDIKESTAGQLRGAVSTWYKTLRVLASVGLLSVLVYVGIRIIISSTSQEKAKYKNMIKDWLVAIALLFVLHYIMAFTMQITDSILSIFSGNPNIVESDGADSLMSSVRNLVTDINDNTNFMQKFSRIVVYIVLVIYTVMFVIQYLKRVVMLAFLTMIAPLITLTYPLDKIKDGQAQAFSMWIREYIFNSLLPVIHIIIYYMLVGSALDFIRIGDNYLYAIVAIGFLIPAEKFFRKMFGFDRASSVGQLGAAAGGALVMNAINKIGHRGGGHGAEKGSNGGASTPRTNRSGYIAAPGNNSVGTSRNTDTDTGTGSRLDTGTGSRSDTGTGSRSDTGTGSINTGSSTVFGETLESGQPAPKRTLGGVKNGFSGVAKRYVNKENGKRMLKGAGRMARKGLIGAAGAATLGTVGLAAGIATGDLSNALKYGAAGAGAGFVGANSIGNKLTDIEKQNRETFKENEWGTDEYNTRNQIKELSDDREFMKTCNQLRLDKEGRERAIRMFHANGITDSNAIKNAMNVQAREGVSQDEIVAAAKINQTLTKSYWGQPKNVEQFKKDLIAKNPNVDAEKAARLISGLKGDLS